MDLKITKKLPEFNLSKFGGQRKVVVVEFPNCIHIKTGRSFQWLPTYKQLEEIQLKLREVEDESWFEEPDI